MVGDGGAANDTAEPNPPVYACRNVRSADGLGAPREHSWRIPNGVVMHHAFKGEPMNIEDKTEVLSQEEV
jgi:hypothetical protein